MNTNKHFTLAAGIINMLFCIVSLIISLRAIILVENAFYIIDLFLALLTFVFSACFTFRYNKLVEGYQGYVQIIIATFVCDCIYATLALLNIILGNPVAIVSLILFALSGIFIMIDYCNHQKGKRPNPLGYSEKESCANSNNDPQNLNNNQTTKDLHESLMELKQMLDDNLLTQGEYEALKAKLIQKFEQ